MTKSSNVTERKFGFYPRVGLDLKHLTIAIDYNLIPNTETDVVTANGIVKTEFINRYIGFRIGGYSVVEENNLI